MNQAVHRPKWGSQLRALTLKNLRIIAKKPVLVVMAALAPLLVFLVVAQLGDMFISTLINGFRHGGSTVAHDDVTQGSSLPGLSAGSTKIFFMSNGGSSTTAANVMNRLCAMTGLQMGSDVVSLGNTDSDYQTLASNLLNGYFALESTPVWGVVSWGPSSDKLLNYTILTGSAQYDLGTQIPVLALQQALDGAILSTQRNPSSYTPGLDSYQFSYDFFSPGSNGPDALTDLPRNDAEENAARSKLNNMGWFQLILIASIGGLSFIPVMTLVIEMVTKEKQRKLLGVLRRMGLMDSAFWVSIILAMIPVCILVSVGASVGVVIVSARNTIFNVGFEVLFIINLCYAFAMLGFGCMIASIVSRPLFVNLSIGMVALACVVVNIVLFASLPSDKVIPPTALWFMSCEAIWAKALFFILAPFYNYGKIWADISIINSVRNADDKSIPFRFSDLAYTPRIFPGVNDNVISDEMDKWINLGPTGITALLLFLSPFFHVLLAWYFGQAVPSEEGFSRGWAFPFMASYWTGKPSRKTLSAGDTLGLEKEKSKLTNTVRMVKISKMYKGVTAVKEFSSVFECGKVYSVLGHNGAGKSTLINMLSLVTTPTYGDCFMFGLDIKEDTVELQNMMALCPQFDILYSSLTPNQHLQFYYSFRGDHKHLSRKQLEEIFQEKLAAVNLADVANVPCGRFSGGMKRRLSLCLATVAESAKIVFLDEPTTGLDPISKRGVWKVIQDLKKDRIVILTTHSMHEADALGDHVCIMHQGRLRASGSSLFLKSTFGEGFQITLVNRDKSQRGGSEEMRNTLESYVKFALPRSTLVSSAGGSMTIAVNKIERGRLVAFLRALKKDEVVDWAIGNSTLEEVFLKLCAQNNEVVTDNEEGRVKEQPICRLCAFRPTEVVHLYTKSGVMIEIPDVVCKICANSVGEPTSDGNMEDSTVDLVSFREFVHRFPKDNFKPSQEKSLDGLGIAKARQTIGSQLSAVMLKNLYLHSKERRVNICALVFLILFIVVTVLAGKTFPSLPANCNGVFFVKSTSLDLSCDPALYGAKLSGKYKDYYSTYSPSPYGVKPVCDGKDECAGGQRPLFSFSHKSAAIEAKAAYGPGFGVTYFSSSNLAATGLSFLGAPAIIKYAQNKGANDLDATVLLQGSNSNASISGSTITQGSTFDKVTTAKVQDYFNSQQQQLISKESSLSSTCPSYTAKISRNGLFASSIVDFASQWNQFYPDVGINVNTLKADSGSVNVNMEVLLYNKASYPAIYIPVSAVQGFGIPQGMFQDCVAMYHTSDGFYSSNPSIAGFDTMFVTINSVTNNALKTLSPNGPQVLASAAFLPSLMNIETTTDPSYSILKLARAFYTMFFILTTALLYPRLVSLLVLEKRENLVEMMRIQGLNLPSYWAGNYLYGFIMILGYNTLYVLISILAGISQVVSAGFGYMFLVAVVWAYGQVCLSVFIASVVTKPTSSTLVSYVLYVAAGGLAPFLVLSVGGNGFSLVWSVFPITGTMSLLQQVTTYGNRSVAKIMINAGVIVLSSTALGLIGMYIHGIRPSAVGIPVDPLLGLSSLFQRPAAEYNPEDDMELARGKRDVDVRAHERRVQEFHATGTDAQPAFDNSEALRVVNLRKVFGKNKVAVENMTLSFRLGETFGMLGPNGAGKTTALSMMTGLLRRTSGSIVINGKSIAANKNARTDEIGVTPQFDTVWPDMTVEEHLKFYCRLRGISRGSITGMVRSIAEAVELDGDAFKQRAGGLSGGMRRRLSIGVALTANPRILVLDEPTTGLDPETRRQIWRIVERIRGAGDKCVVITTHSMDEADALCSRIAIVVDGAVRVLGDQMTLKRKFAEGLKFTFRFSVNHSLRASTDIAQLENSERRRLAEVSAEITRATSLRNLRWNLAASDLRYAHSNVTPASPQQENRAEVFWLVTLECLCVGNVDVSDIFLNVSQACERLGVGDWALNETTLEDVFVKVVGA